MSAKSGLLAVLHLIKGGIVGVAHHLILCVECVPATTQEKNLSTGGSAHDNVVDAMAKHGQQVTLSQGLS